MLCAIELLIIHGFIVCVVRASNYCSDKLLLGTHEIQLCRTLNIKNKHAVIFFQIYTLCHACLTHCLLCHTMFKPQVSEITSPMKVFMPFQLLEQAKNRNVCMFKCKEHRLKKKCISGFSPHVSLSKCVSPRSPQPTYLNKSS